MLSFSRLRESGNSITSFLNIVNNVKKTFDCVVFWVVMPSKIGRSFRCFGKTYFLHFLQIIHEITIQNTTHYIQTAVETQNLTKHLITAK
jgi:hypothetical protein